MDSERRERRALRVEKAKALVMLGIPAAVIGGFVAYHDGRPNDLLFFGLFFLFVGLRGPVHRRIDH